MGENIMELKKNENVKKWEMNELQSDIWGNKYQYNNESFEEWVYRVAGGNENIVKLIKEK